jgi:uncharacterized integral membrane protein
MKVLLFTGLSFLSLRTSAQGDKNLTASGTSDLPLIIGILIAVVAIIAIFFLLRRDDK